MIKPELLGFVGLFVRRKHQERRFSGSEHEKKKKKKKKKRITKLNSNKFKLQMESSKAR